MLNVTIMSKGDDAHDGNDDRVTTMLPALESVGAQGSFYPSAG